MTESKHHRATTYRMAATLIARGALPAEVVRVIHRAAVELLAVEKENELWQAAAAVVIAVEAVETLSGKEPEL